MRVKSLVASFEVAVMADDAVDVRAIGVVVRARREGLSMSRYELSVASAVSHSQITRLEEGRVTGIGVETLVRLSRALQMSPDDILRYSGVETSQSLVDRFGGVMDELTPREREALLLIAEVLVGLRN